MQSTQSQVNKRWRKRPLSPWISWAVFLLLPLLSALIWGGALADYAYLSLRFAQTVGRLDSFVPQLLFTGMGYTPLSSVSWLVLAVPERLGWDTVWVAVVLSALGWGVTAVFWQKLLREWQLPVVDWLIPLLLLFSPLVVMTNGSFVSCFVAAAWLAVLLTVQRKWRWQTIVLLLLSLLSLSITAVALIIILLIWRLVMTRKMAWLAVGLLTAASLLVLAGVGWQVGRSPWLVSFPFADWLVWARQWGYAGEFVWFFVLFALVAVVARRQTWSIAIWLIVALLDVNVVGQFVVASGLLFLAGVGIAVMAQWLVQRDWFDLPDDKVYLGTVLLLCFPLAWVMLSTLRNRHEDLATYSDAVRAGAWLRENSKVEAVLLADPAVGYFANRTVWSWNGRSDQKSWAEFIRIVEPFTLDYIITDNSLFWDGLKHLGWWQDRYTLVQSIGSLDVWQSEPHPALLAKTVPLDVRLENGMKLVGYQQTPQSILPGDDVNLSLHFQMEEPIKYGFGALVSLSSPLGGETQALPDSMIPSALPSNWWNPDQVVTEQFVLTTDEQTPVGGYRLSVSFHTREGYGSIPAYQDGDGNPLDHIQLGYVAVPGASHISETATSLGTTFGDEFVLLAAELPVAQASSGDELDIQFYWEAINANRPQHDYTIFVHLLNEAGELVANADGPPQNGSYPTGAWVPGDVVVDGHRLLLPPDMEPGKYEVRVGAYLLETGERLPVFDETGNELPGASLLLMPLAVE